MVHSTGSLYEDALFAGHFFEVLDLPQLVKEAPDAQILQQNIVPQITFRNVSFVYPNGHRALDDISFTIEPGQSVAFVGVNGAGKSTIMKLLCRFYDPTQGEILIDSIDLRQIKLDSWYGNVGTLFQKFLDFQFSVRDNIETGSHDELLIKAGRYAAMFHLQAQGYR